VLLKLKFRLSVDQTKTRTKVKQSTEKYGCAKYFIGIIFDQNSRSSIVFVFGHIIREKALSYSSLALLDESQFVHALCSQSEWRRDEWYPTEQHHPQYPVMLLVTRDVNRITCDIALWPLPVHSYHDLEC